MAKIMLVEDDNNLREIYEARLQAEGYTIVSAQDGEEALVIAKKEQPDLIISDVMMPKISGFEMLDILRNTEGLKEVKVIMLTALGQNDDQQRADRLGANRYLVKSQVTLEDIVRVAQELLTGEVAAAEPAVTEPTAAATPPAPAATAAPEEDPDMPTVEPAGIAAQPLEVSEPTPAEPVASEPAAPTPVATPVVDEPDLTPPSAVIPAAVEPTATDDSSSPVVAVPAPTDDDAQSTASEEAIVAAQIDTFVSTAPATTPVQEPTTTATEDETPAAESESTPAPAVAPEPTEPATENSETDPTAAAEDSLKALLNQNAVEAPETPQPTPTPESVTEPSTPPAAGHTGGNRVITPINSEPKPDLSELVAIEDAKEIAAGTAPTPVVSSPSTPVAAPTPPAPSANAAPAAPGSTIDPNSISL